MSLDFSFDLGDLYNELIKDHNKNPRNFGQLEGANHHAEGFNAVCGDRIWLDLKIGETGLIEDIKYKGSGCAISVASASIMSSILKGKKTEEAETLFHHFHDLVMGKKEDSEGYDLGKLMAFAGVWKFPARVKCASLAWHTLEAALHDDQKIVSNEGEGV